MLLLSLGKRIPRGQKAARAARTERKKGQKQPCKRQGQRRTRGGDAATEVPLQPVEETRGAGTSLQPQQRTMQEQASSHPHYSLWGTTQWSRWVFPEGAVAYGEPTLKQGKGLRRKEQKRGTGMD